VKVEQNTKIQELQEKLSKAGRAGLLGYGFINTLYYTSFVALALKLSPESIINGDKLSLSVIIRRIFTKFGKVFAIVWAASQVTKLFRLAFAIATVPYSEKLMEYVQIKFSLQSKAEAFWYILGFLWMIAFGGFFAYVIGSLYAAFMHAMIF
jgi:hypothetical protein